MHCVESFKMTLGTKMFPKQSNEVANQNGWLHYHWKQQD